MLARDPEGRQIVLKKYSQYNVDFYESRTYNLTCMGFLVPVGKPAV